MATMLHEGVGHGMVAWLRGDVPTMLTSNHLDAVRADRWVDASGTLVNLLAGAVALVLSRRTTRPKARYFLWLLAAFNLLPGAGYFLYSGIFDFGDWAEVVRGLPHVGLLRVGMVVLGRGCTCCACEGWRWAFDRSWRATACTTWWGDYRTTRRAWWRVRLARSIRWG